MIVIESFKSTHDMRFWDVTVETNAKSVVNSLASNEE